MHPSTLIRRLLLAGLAACVVGGSATAQAPMAPQGAGQPAAQPAEVKVGKTGELIVPLGGVVRFTPVFPKPGVTFTDVLTANDAVVQVRPDVDAKAVQLIGVSHGITTITFTLSDGSKGSYEVVVQPDYELLKRIIEKAVPTASIEVIPGVGSSVIIAGFVTRPEDAETVMRIATAATLGAAAPGQQSNIINAMQVGGLQHVQIEVVLAAVNRTKIRQRGADFSVNGNTVNFNSFFAQILNPSFGNTINAQNPPNFIFGVVPAQIFAVLQALKDESLAKILTEPKVVTQSGRPAIIRSGGEQAVLGQNAGGLGAISVDYRRVGTEMSVLPIVYGNGKIYLEVFPSIVAVNNGLGLATAAGFTPGFSDQSAQASVMLDSGQTFAIGGLLESTVQSNIRKAPILGELPYIGALFSGSRIDERENELLILVTPRLVDALDCSQVPRRVPSRETRGPDDYEFFLEGLLEAPRGQRQVWNGRCYQAAYKCDPTYGIFPCKHNVCGENAGSGGCTTGCQPSFGSRNGHAAPTGVAPVRTAPVETMPAAPAGSTIHMPATQETMPSALVAPVAAPGAASNPTSNPVTAPEVPGELVPGSASPEQVPAPAPIIGGEGSGDRQ